MKKLLSLILILALLLSAASAVADVTITWADVKDITDAPGSFYELNAAALQLWIPDAMPYTAPGDEQIADGVVAVFASEDGEKVCYAQYITSGEATLESLLEEAANDAYFTGAGIACVNGVYVVACDAAEGNITFLMYVVEGGDVVTIAVAGIDDESFANTAYKILGSVMPPR